MVAPALTWESIARGGTAGPGRHWLETVCLQQGAGIKRMLQRMLRSEQDVLDVYQDCMYLLLRRAQSTVVDNVSAYAVRTATNLAVELLRRRKRRCAHWQRITAEAAQASATRLGDTAAVADDEDAPQRQEVRRAVDSLPPHLREVIVLREYQQLTYRRIGQVMNIKPTTARVYRRQAIVRLGAALQAN